MDKSSGAHNFMDETELNSIFGTYSLDICAMTAGLLDELDFDEKYEIIEWVNLARM